MGTQADFEYDAFAELTFPDVGAFQTFFGIAQRPENAARIAADEEKFLDRSKSKCLLIFSSSCVKKTLRNLHVPVVSLEFGYC